MDTGKEELLWFNKNSSRFKQVQSWLFRRNEYLLGKLTRKIAKLTKLSVKL